MENSTKKERKPIFFRFSASTLELLRAYAERECRSVTNAAEKLLTDALERENKVLLSDSDCAKVSE